MEHRPKYHFLPAKNWMNDPNAPIFYQGRHHLFFQYNPTDWRWGNLHWGHAVSEDLLHWEELEMALYPQRDRGETHCYSGCSYLHDGKIELFYTSVGQGDRCQNSGAQQWVATTDDHLRWRQIPENPVLSQADNAGKTLTEWRDPFVFQWKGETFALLAGIVDGAYNAVHIYRSRDMRHWEYLNEFYRNDDPAMVMECPNLVVFGDKVLFIHSIWNVRVLNYFVGTIGEDYALRIEKKGKVDHGDFFASQISFTEKGEPILWGWLREDPRRGLLTDGEWAGVQAIPRMISLDEKNRLVQKRLPAFETLRREHERAAFDGFAGAHVFDIRSNTAELTAEIDSPGTFTLRLLESGDGREHTDILINPGEGTCLALMEDSSLLDGVDKRPLLGTFDKAADGKLRLDILIDCSVVEIFLNDLSCMTLRVYPTLSGKGISIHAAKPLQGNFELYTIAL
jgi:beta-fructofuranosidase